MKQTTSPKSRQQDIIVQELDGEILVYDLTVDKAYCLNETSALVWRLCDGQSSIADISRAVGERFLSPANEDLIRLALDQLKEQNLLSEEGFVSKFDPMSRRQLIRRVGLGTMIALPFITSLVAPQAINAQSSACSGSCTCSVQNTINVTLGAPCRTALGGTSNCPGRATCDCQVTAGSTGGTCVGT